MLLVMRIRVASVQYRMLHPNTYLLVLS